MDKKYRGKVVSLKLMAALVKSAIKHHFNFLYLGTVDVLHAAQRFYHKYGFTLIPQSTLPKQFQLCRLDTRFYKVKTSQLKQAIEAEMEMN